MSHNGFERVLKTWQGKVLLLCLLIAIVGAILIWVGYSDILPNFTSNAKFLHTMMILVPFLCLVGWILEQPAVYAVAFTVLFATLSICVEAAQAANSLGFNGLLTGFILCLAAAFFSFITFPINKDVKADYKDKEVLIAILLFIINLIGLIFIWSNRIPDIQGLMTGFAFLAAVVFGSLTAQYIFLILGTVYVLESFSYVLSVTDTFLKIGYIIVWAVHVIGIMLVLWRISRIRAKNEDYAPLIH